jgi:hypothetical protein
MRNQTKSETIAELCIITVIVMLSILLITLTIMAIPML